MYTDRRSALVPEKLDQRFGWWTAPSKELRSEFDDSYIERQRANSLLTCAQSLETAQAEVHEQNLWSAQLYSNRDLSAFDWGTGNLTRASLSPITRTGENIAVRVVDTLVSQIGKNRPKPKPTARGADFFLRQQIRLLDKFLYAEFQRNDVYGIGKLVFRDSCLFTFGCAKVSCEEDPDYGYRVSYERVFPDEILVDNMEIVACGKIRHFYRRRVLPIEVVASTYKLSAEEADELLDHQASFPYLDYRPIGKGWVVVIEGYQLGSATSPGRCVVASPCKILSDEAWPYDWLPYVWYHYNQPISGFYSPSVVEQILPYQIRLNEINEVIRDAQDVMARPRILVAEGSRVSPYEVDNVIGRFVKYTGIKPEAIVWPAVSAELYNERERLVAACLEQFGLSNMATTVTPPPGARFDSSPALREFNAIQDDRLSDPAQRFEKFYENLALITPKVIKASGGNPKTVWYSGYKQSKAEEIDWSDLALDVDSYVMSMESTSLYSMSPAAARDELEKQLAMGLITPEQYRMELCDPDQESEYSIQAAAAEDLARVQALLEAGEFEEPTPEQDLVNGVQRITLALLNLGKYKNVPPQTKLNFVNWIALAKAILQRGAEEEEPNTGVAPVTEVADPMAQGSVAPDSVAAFGGPTATPIPEAAGLSAIGPGAMPNIT